MSSIIKRIIIILLVLLLIGAGGYGAWYFMNVNPVYTDYSVVKSSERADSQNADYEKFCDGFIRYSRDGIAYYSSENIAQWNTSYQMNNPKVDIRGEYVAVAAIGESRIYVFNKSGYVSEVDTVLPIIAISVSKQGYVAAILQDGTTDVIDMYDTLGDKVYRIKAGIDKTGIPVSISLSDDGIKLMVSYTSIVENEISTSVAFYNFGEVGQNVSERLVGGYEQYGNSVVPMVQFINGKTAVAFGTNLMSIYSVSQYPKLITDIPMEKEIQGVFYSEEYIGLLFISGIADTPYVVNVYDLNGNMISDIYLPKNYREYSFIGKNIFMCDEDSAMLVALDKTVRMNKVFEGAMDALITTNSDDTYIYITSRKVQKIKFE